MKEIFETCFQGRLASNKQTSEELSKGLKQGH